MICKILDLSINTLTSDEKYSLLNRDNLTETIHMQLPNKQKTFCESFSPFLKCKANFEHFEKKHDHHSLEIFENTDYDRRG